MECRAKNSGVTRRLVASSATALAPFSQNSAILRPPCVLGPRATGTVEAMALVEPRQCRRRAGRTHLSSPRCSDTITALTPAASCPPRKRPPRARRYLRRCPSRDGGGWTAVPIYAGMRSRGDSSLVIHLMVYIGVMSRTNIDIDDELIATAMKMYRLDSKRSAVDLALRRLVGEPLSRNEVLAMQGTGFEFTNDDIESFSIADLGPNDDS